MNFFPRLNRDQGQLSVDGKQEMDTVSSYKELNEKPACDSEQNRHFQELHRSPIQTRVEVTFAVRSTTSHSSYCTFSLHFPYIFLASPPFAKAVQTAGLKTMMMQCETEWIEKPSPHVSLKTASDSGVVAFETSPKQWTHEEIRACTYLTKWPLVYI